MKQTLPDLPYDFGALEPVISAQIMQLHYDKHHRAYVTNLNIALGKEQDAVVRGDLAASISLQAAIRFNGGGHLNHSLFWSALCPPDQAHPPEGELREAIDRSFGSFDQLIKSVSAEAVAIQGSGWAWLALHATSGSLVVETTANQDPLLLKGLVPLLGIDVWEHAYCLDYQNMRAKYVEAIWGVVHWSEVANRYLAKR